MNSTTSYRTADQLKDLLVEAVVARGGIIAAAEICVTKPEFGDWSAGLCRPETPQDARRLQLLDEAVASLRKIYSLDGNLWPTRRSLSRMFADHETTDAQH